MNKVRQAWEYLSGKKTVIGTVLLTGSPAYHQVIEGIWEVGQYWVVTNVLDTADWLGMAFGGVGLGHKWVKHRRNNR